MTAPQRIWKPEDLIRLNQLKTQNLPWDAIGLELNRSWAACKVQYFYRLRLAQQYKPETRASYMTKRVVAQLAASEAREMRDHLAARTLTAEFCGDPLPGRSALDRKLAGIVEQEPEVIDNRSAQTRPKPTLATGILV